jgi:mannosyltransferase
MSATGSAPRIARPRKAAGVRMPPARDLLAIGVPAVLAAVLSMIEITGRSLGFDEGATATIAAQHGSALGSAIAHDGGNMSGYYLLEHVLIAAFGNGELVLRLPSAVAYVATVAVVGTIGLRLLRRSAGFAAGLLCAVSLPLVFWAQSARGYALMVAFVAAAFLVLVIAAEPRTTVRRPVTDLRIGHWFAFTILMALATYSSYVAVLVIPAQFLVLLPAGHRRALRPFLISFAAYALLCVPLFVLAVRRGSGQLFWVPRPTHKIELQVLEALTSAAFQPSFHRTSTTILLLVITGVALIAIAAWVLRTLWRGARSWELGLVLAWFAVPVAITFVYSLIAQPLFQPRNVLMSVPPVALLLAAALTHRRVPRIAAIVALAGLVGLRALQLAPSYGVSPEPWQQATAYVLARARPGDCIAFYPLDGRMAFQYYIGTARTADRRAPRSILPVVGWGAVKPYVERYETLSPAQITSRGAGCRRLWFVSSHEGQTDGPAQSLANRARFLALRARLERAFGRARVVQLGYAAAIHIQLLRRVRDGARRRTTSAG